MQLLKYVTSSSALPEKGVQATLRLLQEDCTLPFIARYRKEATGGIIK